MKKLCTPFALWLVAELLLALGRTGPAAAVSLVKFTVVVESAFVRDAPSAAARVTYSVFHGQTFAVTGRNGAASWVRLDLAGASNGTWIPVTYGTVTGDLMSLPVVAVTTAPVAQMAVATRIAGTTWASQTSGAANAQAAQQFAITAHTIFARSAPAWSAAKVVSLLKGQTLAVTGRDASARWLQFSLGGRPAWVPAGAGRLSGDVLALRVVLEEVAPAAAPLAPLPAWIPEITPRMRQIYQNSGLYGRNLRMLTVAGDCNSESSLYLELATTSLIDPQLHDYLMPTLAQFRPSFSRKSLAVSGGFNTSSMFDPLWADPSQCRKNEGPFACELRLSKASIVFIMLGTGDQFDWPDFEARYRLMVDHALAKGVLPVLVTKADALEAEEGGAEPDYINNIVRRLAREYELPLLDFWLATRALANNGLLEEPGHDFHLTTEAHRLHVLTTLQTLYAIWGR